MVDIDITIKFGEIADLTSDKELNKILKKNFKNREVIGHGVWNLIIRSLLEWSRQDIDERHTKLDKYLKEDSIRWIEVLTASKPVVRKAALEARKEDYPDK